MTGTRSIWWNLTVDDIKQDWHVYLICDRYHKRSTSIKIEVFPLYTKATMCEIKDNMLHSKQNWGLVFTAFVLTSCKHYDLGFNDVLIGEKKWQCTDVNDQE